MLTVRGEKCVGCSLCVLACSFAHSNVFSEMKSRVRIARNVTEYREVPLLCIQCAPRHCVKACEQGALKIDEGTGAIVLDREKCIRCGRCIAECSFKGIHKDEEGYPLICDLCNGEVWCTKFCPTRAIARSNLAGERRLAEENRILAHVWGVGIG